MRVVGGWTEFQFAERRMPTLEEINAAAPDMPVFVLHLYDRALLNAAALRAVGYTARHPESAGRRDRSATQAGNPTGLLIAQPNALILYTTLAQGPKLGARRSAQLHAPLHARAEPPRADQRHRRGRRLPELPRRLPVIEKLHRDGQLTLRIAYNLFTQNPGKELDDFAQLDRA